MSRVTIVLPRRIAERVEQEARRLGASLEEYVVKMLLRNADPQEKARDYLEAAKLLLEQAREELGRGDVRQAAEKVWEAVVLSVKAYAWWREGRRLLSHRELWVYKEKLVGELGEWARLAWLLADSMYKCFYEGECQPGDVETALEYAEKLVNEIAARMARGRA